MKKLGWLAGTALGVLVFQLAVGAGQYDSTGGTVPSRGRSAALLTALFHHDAQNPRPRAEDGSRRFTSANPKQAAASAERGKVVAFANSLVYEGGYYPSEIYKLLGAEGGKNAKVGRIMRQLDASEGKKPAPWEVAGRVGRSDLGGVSDNWAMAPGEPDEEGISSPGTLAYLPMLAIAYAAYPQDGLEAAAQLATLKDDDIRAAAAARGGVSLLMRVLVAAKHDKDAWLRDASTDTLDPDTEHDLRTVRVKDWKYLRGEECAMGRLERAIYIWYKGESYQEIMAEGRKQLRSREGLAYLATLAAATYGMESMPERVIVSGASDSQLLRLIDDLHDLATSEALLQVHSENE